MIKRAPLDLNQFKIDLPKQSRDPLETIIPTAPQVDVQAEQQKIAVSKPPQQKADKSASKKTTQQVNNIASNMTILHFTDDEIEELREPAYKAQTFRLTDREIEWVKDTAYRLSKEVRRGKVSQVDILRIAFKLFENLLSTNKADLLTILEKVK